MLVFQTTWRCERRTEKCTGRVHLKSDNEVIKEIEHNLHGPDPAWLNALKVKEAVKVAAVATVENPARIIAQAFSNASIETVARIPHIRSVTRNIKKIRQKNQPCHELPASAADTTISQELKKSLNGESFLLYDSAESDFEKRILVFGTRKMFDALLSAEENLCELLKFNHFCSLSSTPFTQLSKILFLHVPTLFF